MLMASPATCPKNSCCISLANCKERFLSKQVLKDQNIFLCREQPESVHSKSVSDLWLIFLSFLPKRCLVVLWTSVLRFIRCSSKGKKKKALQRIFLLNKMKQIPELPLPSWALMSKKGCWLVQVLPQQLSSRNSDSPAQVAHSVSATSPGLQPHLAAGRKHRTPLAFAAGAVKVYSSENKEAKGCQHSSEACAAITCTSY